MRVVLDIEANGLENVTKIWLVVAKDIDTGELHIFRETDHEAFKIFSTGVTLWIGHNILGYDWPVLVSVWGCTHPAVTNVIDTLICSKLADYPRDGHSIEQYGLEFGYPKINYSDFSKYTPEMEEYCVRDVEICHKIYLKYLKYINNPDFRNAIVLEHKFQLIVNDLHNNGFAFDSARATKLLEKVTLELSKLDKDILEAFPPKLKLIKEITPKETKHGTLHKGDFRWVTDGDLSIFNGGSFCRCDWVPFNPSSTKQIVDVLHSAGWNPVNKTKTRIELERTINRLKYKRDEQSKIDLSQALIDQSSLGIYGFKVDEPNLNTLPECEPLKLWKDKCRVKIDREHGNTVKSIIERIQPQKESMRSNITIKISDITETNILNELMECLLTTLSSFIQNKMDVVKFVEKENFSWSIIATPQDWFVDCSASFVTDTWVGLRDTQQLQVTILKLQAARLLAQRILLESRRRTLTEWLSLVHPDGRIRGKFMGIGAWTHRMAHQNPNTANIPNEFDILGKTKLFGKEMRQLWCVPKNRLLVGVDAEGIQLRIFAHYINDQEFTDALVNGDKKLKTDPHSLNQRILGSACRSRAAAKRFIFALLLGAGINKLAEILACSEQECRVCLDRMLERYTGFQYLKETIIPSDGKRGWFTGLDGRPIKIPGDTANARSHLAMSGYLQGGEAIVTRKATVKFAPELPKYDAFLVDLVHDEWQTECPNDYRIAKEICELQCNALKEVGEELKLNCPLAGSYWNDDHKDYTIGKTWYETH